MMTKCFIAVCLLACVIWQIDGMKKCLKPHPVTIDEHFLLPLAKKSRLYIPIHSNCDNCEENDEFFEKISGRTIPKRICYKLFGSRKDGSDFDVTFKCQYSNQDLALCEMVTDQPPYLAASWIPTKTDNKTYIAYSACIFGKANFWWVASTTETLTYTVEREIIDDFEKRGFKKNNVAVEGGSSVFFRSVTLDHC